MKSFRYEEGCVLTNVLTVGVMGCLTMRLVAASFRRSSIAATGVLVVGDCVAVGLWVREGLSYRMMNEPDPYAPPKSREDVPLQDEERRRKVDVMLRWAGAMSMGWLVVTALVRWESGAMVVKMAVVVVWSGIFAAFLYGGRRWQLGIAMFMLMVLLTQVQSGRAAMNDARKVGTAVSADEWWSLAAVSVACAITTVCGVALFVRGRKR